MCVCVCEHALLCVLSVTEAGNVGFKHKTSIPDVVSENIYVYFEPNLKTVPTPQLVHAHRTRFIASSLSSQHLWLLWWVHVYVQNMTSDNSALASTQPIPLSSSLCVCVCVCVCVCARARACVRACMPACMHACVRACMRESTQACNKISVLEEMDILLLKVFAFNTVLSFRNSWAWLNSLPAGNSSNAVNTN